MAGSPLTPEDRRIMMEALEADGWRLTKAPVKERARAKLDVKFKPGATVRIGVVSDTHIGSKFQQVASLRDFYKYADSIGTSAFLHAGDMLEGIHQAHRDAAYEQYVHGVDAQVNAVVKQYPKSDNGLTYFVDGNHDDWAFQNVGVTSGAMIEAKRPDFRYLGYHSAFVELGNMRFLIQHGSKGGSSYAKSYKAQKLVEGLADGERTETDVALFGHYHQDAYIGRYMGVFSFMLGCFKSQDRFLRMLGKNPTIGGLILEIETDRASRIWNITQKWRYYSPVLNDYPGGDLA